MKKLILFMTAIAVMMTLIGCPPAGNQPAQNQEEINKAASGLENNLTVVGKIEDTTCDIVLNAADGTFSATQSSRSGEASYSGEFFYYNGKLQLMVTSKNDQRLSMADTFCLTATLEEEVLTNNETVIFETQEVTAYETAKEEFRAANPIKTFSLAGMRFYSEDLHVSSTMTINGKDTTSDGISKAFFDFTENSVYSNFFNTGSGAASMSYTLSGDKITMIVDINETITSVGSTGEIQTKLVVKGTLTGKLSADKKSISIIGDCLSTSSAGTISMSQTVSYSGTFTKSNAAVYLGGKTYTATSAKIGGKDVGNASSIKLKFIDKYNAEFINGTQTINIFKSAPYLVNETVVIQTPSLTVDGQNYYGNLTGTLSSDKNTITINCNLQTLDDDNQIVEVPFVWTFKLDNSSTTSSTIPSGTNIDPSVLRGKRFVADRLTFTQYANGQMGESNTQADAILDFVDENKVTSPIVGIGGATIENMTYSITGNTINMQYYFDPGAGTENAGKTVQQASFTCTLSDDGNRISDFSGEWSMQETISDLLGELGLQETNSNENTVSTRSISCSNATFINKGEIVSLKGKSYTATVAKYNNENMTGTVELTFDTTYDFDIKQNGSSLINWSRGYKVINGNIEFVVAIWNLSGCSGSLSGTVSSDYKTISVTANLTNYSDNTTNSLEFEFSLNEGTTTTTTTTISSGTTTTTTILDQTQTFSLAGRCYSDRDVPSETGDHPENEWPIYSGELIFPSETGCIFGVSGMIGAEEHSYTIDYTERKVVFSVSNQNYNGTVVGIVSEDLNTITLSGEIQISNSEVTLVMNAQCVYCGQTTDYVNRTFQTRDGSSDKKVIAVFSSLREFTLKIDDVSYNCLISDENISYNLQQNTFMVQGNTKTGLVKFIGTDYVYIEYDNINYELIIVPDSTTTTTIPDQTQTFNLDGMRFYSAGLHSTSVISSNGTDTTSDGISTSIFFDFTGSNVVTNMIPIDFHPYTISGNTITINVNQTTRDTDISSTTYTGTLTGVLSDDGQSIDLTGDLNLVVEVDGSVTTSGTGTYTGTLNHIQKVNLTGVSYSAVSVKIDDEDVTNDPAFQLEFVDGYNFEITQGDQLISASSYMVVGNQFNLTLGFTIDGVIYSGVLSGTGTDDTLTLQGTLTGYNINEMSSVQSVFEWTFALDD